MEHVQVKQLVYITNEVCMRGALWNSAADCKLSHLESCVLPTVHTEDHLHVERKPLDKIFITRSNSGMKEGGLNGQNV